MTKKGHAQKSWYQNIGEAEGKSLSEIIGEYSHFHPDDRIAMNKFLTDICSKFSRNVKILKENGEYTWTHVNLLVKKFAPQIHIIELISINYDITELKRTEEMLMKARDKAEESDRLKSAFLANMSHEIRTPLNAIVGFLSLLVTTENMEEKELYSSLINHNNDLLLNLINDVLDLSKIESGYIAFHQSWFNLRELIIESAAEHSHVNSAAIKLITKFPECDYPVELDQLRIKQLLNKLNVL